MKRLVLWAVVLGLFVGTLWIGWSLRAGNAAPVNLDLIWLQVVGIELWRAILMAMGFGAGFSAILVGFAWLRARLLNRRYRKAIARLESELHEMRSLPLAGHDADLPGRTRGTLSAGRS